MELLTSPSWVRAPSSEGAARTVPSGFGSFRTFRRGFGRARFSMHAARVLRKNSLTVMQRPVRPQSNKRGFLRSATELSTKSSGGRPSASGGYPKGGQTKTGKPVSWEMSFSLHWTTEATGFCTAFATFSISVICGWGTTLSTRRPSTFQATVCINTPWDVKDLFTFMYWSQADSPSFFAASTGLMFSTWTFSALLCFWAIAFVFAASCCLKDTGACLKIDTSNILIYINILTAFSPQLLGLVRFDIQIPKKMC